MQEKTLNDILHYHLEIDTKHYFFNKKITKNLMRKLVCSFQDGYKLGFKEGCFHQNHKHK